MASLSTHYLPAQWTDIDNTELNVFALGYDYITEYGTEVDSERCSANLALSSPI
jgi:hypothetical protein